jgi:hypothetical protein
LLSILRWRCSCVAPAGRLRCFRRYKVPFSGNPDADGTGWQPALLPKGAGWSAQLDSPAKLMFCHPLAGVIPLPFGETSTRYCDPNGKAVAVDAVAAGPPTHTAMTAASAAMKPTSLLRLGLNAALLMFPSPTTRRPVGDRPALRTFA